MRITNSSLNRNFLRNLNNNLKQMEKYQNQLSSGKQVSKPSDNPLLVGKIMSMGNQISENEQYNSNISDSIGWVRTQDTALAEASDSMIRIKELSLKGANGTLAKGDREAIRGEIEQEIGHLVDVFNTNFDGRYVFGGQATMTRPFELEYKEDDGNLTKEIIGIKQATDENGDTISGQGKDLERVIGNGVKINLATSSAAITGKTIETDEEGKPIEKNPLGEMFKDLLSAFRDEKDPSGKINGVLDSLETQTDRIVRVRTRIGAIDNRLESALARNEAENINLKEVLSEKEDIDIAEKYMESVVASTIYQASLSIGSKVIQPTLLDFIR